MTAHPPVARLCQSISIVNEHNPSKMSYKVPYDSPTKSGNPGVVKKAELSSSTVTFFSDLQDEISQLIINFKVSNINALSKQLLAGAENAPTTEEASDNVLLPIQMLDKELGLKRLLFMLNLTMKELIKDDRGPHGPHIEDENDIWDHVVVLTYIFLDKMYPKIEALCDDDGFFRPKNITGLVDELSIPSHKINILLSFAFVASTWPPSVTSRTPN